MVLLSFVIAMKILNARLQVLRAFSKIANMSCLTFLSKLENYSALAGVSHFTE